MIPHWPISDTALAAALGTLGVPLDPVQPYSRLVDTDSGHERLQFLFRDRSDTDATRKTEDIIAAWEQRPRFEREFPNHPLNPMRLAHDARTHLIAVRFGREPLVPVANFKGDKFSTPHLHEAAILKAHGFPLLAVNDRAYTFPSGCRGMYASKMMDVIARPQGATPAQWMARFLINFNAFLDTAKNAVPILMEREDNRALLLPADATTKTVDLFHELF